ncbi:MAG TPA: 5-oxoprolinase subunit PxpB [Chitinophagaceae bacterium]
MNQAPAYSIFSSGDAALTIDFGNVIDVSLNEKVMTLFTALQKQPLPGMIEAVPAYSSLTLFYDVAAIKKKAGKEALAYDWIKEQLQKLLVNTAEANETSSRFLQIPVCYEAAFAPGINELANAKGLPIEEIISLHASKKYRVYMLGFLPGFAYMGDVDERISMPRKTQPENVVAGSVGIAGKQTGIYPLASPGGWCIIGRTPLRLFDPEGEGESLFKAGDTVQFISITQNEFESYQRGHS